MYVPIGLSEVFGRILVVVTVPRSFVVFYRLFLDCSNVSYSAFGFKNVDPASGHSVHFFVVFQSVVAVLVSLCAASKLVPIFSNSVITSFDIPPCSMSEFVVSFHRVSGIFSSTCSPFVSFVMTVPSLFSSAKSVPYGMLKSGFVPYGTVSFDISFSGSLRIFRLTDLKCRFASVLNFRSSAWPCTLVLSSHSRNLRVNRIISTCFSRKSSSCVGSFLHLDLHIRHCDLRFDVKDIGIELRRRLVCTLWHRFPLFRILWLVPRLLRILRQVPPLLRTLRHMFVVLQFNQILPFQCSRNFRFRVCHVIRVFVIDFRHHLFRALR